MSRKKETSVTLSQEVHDQVQSLLTHYQALAQTLQGASNQAEAETALGEFNALPEAAQLSLLKLLAKKQDADAADVLLAVNTLSPHKEVRKEARRSLIRLEASKTYPRWQPPRLPPSAIQTNTPHPPRFWKGWATQTREEGEIHLVLSWEQGYDYSEARILVFLLDYWQDGMKDCVVEAGPRRRIDEEMMTMRSKLHDIPTVDCTPTDGRRLLQEALSVNEWRGNEPPKQYRNNLPLINNLLDLATSEQDETDDHVFINPELDYQEVVLNFLGAWALGDYGLAYDLLTPHSEVRDRLSRADWVDLHRSWAKEALPARMELGFVHEREESQSAIWVPSTSRTSSRKEIEIGWSLELTDTPLHGTLKEMPMGTAVNKDTRRHWFWTRYTLVQEHGAWRIQQIHDEGALAQGLSIADLQKRIKEHEEAVEQRLKQRDGDTQAFIAELSWRLTQLLHYYDALLVLLPLDYQVNETAYNRSVMVGNPERIQVYLERLLQRFPQNRQETQQRLASILTTLAFKYDQPELEPRQQHLLSRAETLLREAIDNDQSAVSYTLLAELFLSQGRNDEAETALLQAKEHVAQSSEEASSIEAGLGNIAMRRERVAEALPHYQRVIEIDQSYPGIWFNLGFAHRLLGHFDEAEASYQQAIQAAPNDVRPYSELIALAMNQGNTQKAREIAEQSVAVNPESAHLRALLASVLFELGDQQAARQQLATAETIDPNLPIVQSVRQHIYQKKKK